MNIAHFEVSIQTIKNSVLNCMMSNRGSQTMLISDLGQNVPMFLVSVIHFTCTLVKSGYAKTILVAGMAILFRKCFTKVRNGQWSTNKYHKCHSWPVCSNIATQRQCNCMRMLGIKPCHELSHLTAD